jgi:hypothetical protein
VTPLPVSGITLAVGEPSGEDELFVVETALAPLPAWLQLARRVGTSAVGGPLDWMALPAADLAAAALTIRRAWIGDAIRTDTECPSPGCGERIDVNFGVGDYLEHHRPRRPRGVTRGADDGWFTLTGVTVRFRIPTVGDLVEARSGDRPDAVLAERCVDPPEVSRAFARRLDRALSALAPSLDGLVGGSCPACGHELTMRFDPLAYTLSELRDAFSGIHLETHALASAYGWPEPAILALPRDRRRRYAALAVGERWVA